jgi:hypothetical protein
VPSVQLAAARDPSLFLVRFGQHTFDAEGVEASGKFFSRRIGYPGGMSGVTIGRGYDMGGRTSKQVLSELTSAGMPEADARELSQGAGLRGVDAKRYVSANLSSAPIMSPQVQKSLFEDVVTPIVIADIQRILRSASTVSHYGAVSWGSLSPGAKELLFDLRFRGDYTPHTRERLQPLLVGRDDAGLKRVIDDSEYWRRHGVPEARIKARQSIASGL